MDLTDLPRHATAVDGLVDAVEAAPTWRWLELGCSLAAGRGDEWSDIDAGAGYGDGVTDVEAAGLALVVAGGEVVDALVHVLPGWPADTCRRVGVEYRSGVQLDLVVMPATLRPGLPPTSAALVDKDGTLSKPYEPAVQRPPSDRAVREWSMLAWWAVSDVAKYVARGSLFEAVARLEEARSHALRLFAARRRVPEAAFGLTALLDHEPFALPDGLARTYGEPSSAESVLRATEALTALLEEVATPTPWADVARRRLSAAGRG